MHNFKWTKDFTASFNKHLQVYFNFNSIQQFRSNGISQISIDEAYISICKNLIKSARQAEKECNKLDFKKLKFRSILNKNCHLNKEFLEIKNKIRAVYIQRKLLGHRQRNEETILRKLKRYLRQLQKLILQKMNNDNSKKFEYLFKCQRSRFWQQVNSFRKKKVVKSSQLNIDKFKDYYSSCFNSNGTTSTESHLKKQNEVSEKLNLIINEQFHLNFPMHKLNMR